MKFAVFVLPKKPRFCNNIIRDRLSEIWARYFRVFVHFFPRSKVKSRVMWFTLIGRWLKSIKNRVPVFNPLSWWFKPSLDFINIGKKITTKSGKSALMKIASQQNVINSLNDGFLYKKSYFII